MNEIYLMEELPSKKAVKRAGDRIRAKIATDDDFEVVSYWRAAHAIPMNSFKDSLKSKMKKTAYKSGLISRRLKRMPSVTGKLIRFPEMDLSRMQDIAGVRVVLRNIATLDKFKNDCFDSYNSDRRLNFKFVRESDYIYSPKKDGYRSLHQIFEYTGKKYPELKGLKVELQIRTRLQHAWATAVEALGLAMKSSFKTGEGDDEHKLFFKLCSSAFSFIENTNQHDDFKGYSVDQILEQLYELESKINVLERLVGISSAYKHIETPKTEKKPSTYHLIILDLDKRLMDIRGFNKRQLINAESAYLEMEKVVRDNNLNWEVVLISIDDIKKMKIAYPNYFLNSQEFVREVNKIIGPLRTKNQRN